MAKARIQEVAQTDKAGLFTICFEGESYSEFQKFIVEHSDAYSKDLNIILSAIQHMLNTSGMLERYFRPEGKMSDGVCALPIETSKLRLYCVRVNDNILIAGNGGVKNTARYEQNEKLNGYVISLQKLDKAIKVALKKGTITIEGKTIEGIDNKNFDL
ncbi:MAG: hypothetical protein KBT34_05615 [Prevotella sp.]|nr:hypothetical protein [Candidatus Prevotella equi]